MIRKLLLLATVALGCLSTPAYGLGLGELELNSALNQQFSAEIELTNVRGLQVEEILPNLASQEDFDRVGVERNYLLTDLRFRVVPGDDGALVIRVTSSKPIIEPFLNFIVEVLWPTGRILREYTVLLDPPVFGEGGVEAVRPSQTSAPAVTQSSQTQAQPTQSRQAPPAPRVAPRTPATETPSAAPRTVENNTDRRGQISGDEYGMTGQGDTLWNIALRVRPNDTVSVQQTMLALQRANPEAFINNNINLLKAGYVLRIPDVREIREETVATAVRKVRNQNQDFDSYKEGGLAQLDATRRQTPSRDRDVSTSSGELKLLASDDTSSRSGSGDSARAAELENELAVAEEDLDRARRANSELNLKMEDIQGQLDTLNEILTLKDDQIAALRAELQRVQAAPAQPAPAPVQQSGSLFSNPLVLGGLGLLLVAAVVGLLMFLKRRQQAASSEDDFEDFAAVEETAEAPEETVEEPVETAAEEEEEDVAPETSDVLGEVEIYIAYGRFPQAITFLQNAIEAEPDRADIQLKLLEVYVQTEDSVAFNLQLDQLRLLGDQAAIDKALELQQKIPGAAEDAAVAMDATVISNEPVEAIAEPADDDDDDLSFDLDDLDAETEDDDLDLSAELDLDEDLDLSLEADETGADDTVVLDENEIELSLQDADDELELELDDGEIELDLDDDELDIDLDLDSDESDEVLDANSTVELDEEVTLDLDGDDALELDEEITLDLDDDELDLDADLEINLDDDDTLDLNNAGADEEVSLDLEDELDLDDDDDVLDLSAMDDDEPLDLEQELESVASELGEDDDDALSIDLDDDLDIELDGDDEISLDLDDDDEISLDLNDDDEISLDLSDDDEISLDLESDDDLSIDLDDDGLDLDLDDDDDLLDLSDEDDNKLDLARAYVDMGDTEGAKSLLQEIVESGTEAEKQEAAELMEKLDS
jgi:pilus assembly protein FimV